MLGFIFFLATVAGSFASEFNEQTLILQVEETSAFKGQQAQSEATFSASEATRAKYQPELQGRAGYGESKEDPLFQFSPIINPSRSSSVGVAQRLPIGVSAKIEGFSEQITIPAFNVHRVNRTGARLNLEIDLLANFLGRRDLSELKNAKIKKQVATIQSQLNTHALIQDLRKAYWSYMGLEESRRMAEALLNTAKKSSQEIQSRKKVGAADLADVARAQAQLANRQTQVSVIDYQKEQIYQQLKQQYPELTTINYQSTQEALKEVYDCIQKIKTDKEFRSASDFTQLVDLLEEEKRLSLKQANTLSDWDVKLQGQYQQNAVGQGFNESQQNFYDQGKDAYQVALLVSVPLGSGRSKSEKHAVNQVTYSYTSQIGQISQTITTQHQRALNSLALLESAVGTQELSVTSLRSSADSARKKYNQARISQIEFILEQDKLFATEVESIQNRIQIINETLDYLKTFNKKQCLFNKTKEV